MHLLQFDLFVAIFGRFGDKWVNTLLRPGQNGQHFAGDIFKVIFLNENFLHFDCNFTEICSWESNEQ